MQRLSMQHTVPDSFVISVNVSSQELHTANYVNRIRALLEETGAHPDWLEIEITESGLVENGNTTLEQFFNLKSLGLKLSIDDFGTGYSSLSYLRQFPVDTLKIDQAFVREISHAQDALLIVKSIIGLAKAMNLSVVAEGVETLIQKRILSQEGCDEIQGYYFSRPLSVTALTKLLETPAPFSQLIDSHD
ncbi:hypothetical protein BI364_16405 [Acidihalobacter yilgarnensis]|uniref:EAL domain-containing protein n=2 Tax=Acidihalobacter yilgarnensis TaxID=2819280 RepID=A0A1D8IS39_9GAMM|nr:hypothetical protein BI364_16405 [Acidihalobacter yilgarnensis]